MESVEEMVAAVETPPPPAGGSGGGTGKSGGGGGTDAARISEVKSWLMAQFEAVGREVPDFEYTPRSVAHLHAIASLSQARTRAASIVASDLRQKASEYRSQGPPPNLTMKSFFFFYRCFFP